MRSHGPRHVSLVGALVLVLIAPGAGARRAPPPPSPAGPGSMAPALSSGPDGRVRLSWLEPRAGGGHRLRCARWTGTRWSPPITIAEGDSFVANAADTPGLLALPDGRMIAHWRWRIGSDRDGYEVRLSQSVDRGATWSRPVRAHADASVAEHGFVSTVRAADGPFLAWLDGGKGAGKPEGAGETELRAGWLAADGSVAGERPLDARVCDCCPTSAVAIPGGILMAYRDRSAKEVRDIALVRREKGRWSKPYPLHADGWTIAGCPVNGPALAAEGDRVVAAWFTGAADEPRVLAAFSQDGGAHFGAPVIVDRTAPIGRVQAVMLPDGTALVAWLGAGATAGGDAAILAARVSIGGAGAATRIARASGMPRMALAGDTAILAWTEAGPAGPGRTSRAATQVQAGFLPLTTLAPAPH